jgi:hypothetical protein
MDSPKACTVMIKRMEHSSTIQLRNGVADVNFEIGYGLRDSERDLFTIVFMFTIDSADTRNLKGFATMDLPPRREAVDRNLVGLAHQY